MRVKKLFFWLFGCFFDSFWLFGGFSSSVGFTFGYFLLEFVDSTFDVGKFLGAGKERVAVGADFDLDFG